MTVERTMSPANNSICNMVCDNCLKDDRSSDAAEVIECWLWVWDLFQPPEKYVDVLVKLFVEKTLIITTFQESKPAFRTKKYTESSMDTLAKGFGTKR